MVNKDRPKDDKDVGNSKDFLKTMNEQRGNIVETKNNKEKVQIKILEVKKLLEIKNSLDKLNNRLDTTEEKFSSHQKVG